MNEYTAGDTAAAAAKPKVAQARKRVNFRFIRTEIDKPFCLLILVLLVLGIVMMFSASYARAIAVEGDGYVYLVKQIKAAGIGIVGMLIA